MIKLTKTEQLAVISLSSIMGLRMLGLFMVIPLFSLYTQGLTGATPILIGLATSIYGLSQALFQLPFGFLSDRMGRKPIILLGLIIFIIGSIICGLSHSIHWMIIGRALQGVGAVGSTLLAMLADLTREEHRSKAMAIIGMTIGAAFSLAMVLGPLLSHWLAVNELFYVSACFGFIAIFLLYKMTPTALTTNEISQPTSPGQLKSFNKHPTSLKQLITNPNLTQLNIGIFILHAVFTATFIALPIHFNHAFHLAANEQWILYLPTLIVASVIALIMIGIAESKRQIKRFFQIGISILACAELLFCFTNTTRLSAAIALTCFFIGFSLLEAFLPSWVSRVAPAEQKGSALGIYSCMQFLGIFIGGLMAGWLYGQFTLTTIYVFCIILTLFWFSLAFFMQPPHYFVTQAVRLTQKHWETLATKFEQIPGMVEVIFVPEEEIAYLKMERRTTNHPDFIRLKEELTLMM